VTSTQPTLKVNGPAGIVAAAEAMLGFIPQDSLVMVCMSGERRRLGPVARVNLPPGPDYRLTFALVQHALNHATEVVLISYQHNKQELRFVADVRALLRDVSMPLHDSLTVVARKRIWSRDTGEQCPLAGPDDPHVQALAAGMAEAGRGMLASREQLAESIAAPSSGRMVQAREAFSRPVLLRDRAEITQEVLAAAQRGQVTPVRAAALVRAVERNWEWFVAQVLTELDEPWVPALVAVTGWTPTHDVTDVAALLAIAAYRHGDGALAQLAVDRALKGDDGNEVANMMIVLMSEGVHPDQLGHWMSRAEGDL
jgi:hypothetical protein